MRANWRATAAAFAAVAVAVTLVGCAAPSSNTPGAAPAEKGPIRVGSKIDGEGSLLGQLILTVLKQNGFTVEDKTRTGATDVVRKALVSGQIDIYPEYTANSLLVFNKDKNVAPSVLKDAQATYLEAAKLDLANGIVWLKPAPANNTWAVALPRAFATANGLKSMEDWAAYINRGAAVKIVGSQEFFTSAAAMPAFETAYGFKLKPGQIVALASGDTAVTEKAAAQGSNGANAAMAYGTDGTVAALDLVVLSDPKGAQPVYQPAPTLRKAIADKYPEIATLLDPVFERLTLETLQKLNGQVAVDGKDPKAVVSDWLKSEGLLK
ncbi:MAG TPA: glycine betaine ABC transporter substrate-binding protein [Coriobacteriia bacterium]